MTTTKKEMTPLERAAMQIVLEASQTSTAPTRYVRREYIADLEAALRARGWDVDAGFAHMKEKRKEERRKHVARLEAFRKKQSERDAEWQRRNKP